MNHRQENNTLLLQGYTGALNSRMDIVDIHRKNRKENYYYNFRRLNSIPTQKKNLSVVGSGRTLTALRYPWQP